MRTYYPEGAASWASGPWGGKGTENHAIPTEFKFMVYLVRDILVLVLFKSTDSNNSVINSFPNFPENWFLLFNSLHAQQKTSLPYEEWPHLLHSFPPAEEYLISPPLLLLFSHSVMSNSCDPMDCSAPGSSVHGISQGRILEWVAIFSSRASSWPRDQIQVSKSPALQRILYHWTMWEALTIK